MKLATLFVLVLITSQAIAQRREPPAVPRQYIPFQGEWRALKYCGQGVEGIHFENFRPPSSCEQKPMDGEVRVTLERKTQ